MQRPSLPSAGHALPSAAIVRIPVPPQARLLAAVRMLERRLEEQRVAVAAWRDEVAKLAELMASVAETAKSADDQLRTTRQCLPATGSPAVEREAIEPAS